MGTQKVFDKKSNNYLKMNPNNAENVTLVLPGIGVGASAGGTWQGRAWLTSCWHRMSPLQA